MRNRFVLGGAFVMFLAVICYGAWVSQNNSSSNENLPSRTSGRTSGKTVQTDSNSFPFQSNALDSIDQGKNRQFLNLLNYSSSFDKESHDEEPLIDKGLLSIEDPVVRVKQIKHRLKIEERLLESHETAVLLLKEKDDEIMLDRLEMLKNKSEQRILLLTSLLNKSKQ